MNMYRRTVHTYSTTGSTDGIRDTDATYLQTASVMKSTDGVY